jgi:hypothetical protein
LVILAILLEIGRQTDLVRAVFETGEGVGGANEQEEQMTDRCAR